MASSARRPSIAARLRFDTSYGYLRGQIDPYTHRYKFGDHVTWHRNDQFVEERGHVTDLITEEAIRVIESAGKAPFFLYVAHHSPHYPLNEPPKWIAPYEKTIDDVWRRHYAAAVTHLDDGVGRIVEALERTGLRENTLIVFSSDNGGQQSWSAPEKEYNGRYATPLRGWTLTKGALGITTGQNLRGRGKADAKATDGICTKAASWHMYWKTRAG
jgi:arylsulfatase A-like enzyme